MYHLLGCRKIVLVLTDLYEAHYKKMLLNKLFIFVLLCIVHYCNIEEYGHILQTLANELA